MAQTVSEPRRAFVPQPSDVSVGEIGRALVVRWRWIAVPTALAFVASLAFVMLVSPRYTGEARLLLQANDSYFTRPGGNERFEQQPQIDDQAVASQVQVVMSRDLARDAIRRLGLVGTAEFDPEVGGLGLGRKLAILLRLARDPSGHPAEERVLETYYDNLLVYPVGKSRIVSIEFRSRNPDLAAQAANTIADLYLGLQGDAKKDQARSASTWLGSNIETLRKRVAEAEAKVEAFRARTGLLTGAGTTTISAQQLSESSTQLAQARTAQSDAQAKARLIRDTIRDGRAFDIPDVANNELIRRLLEQRINLKAQLALELRTLLPQHPRIKELNAQLSDLEAQMRVAAERTVRSLENESRIAGARVESIEATIEKQKKVVADANENEVQLRALEREARTQREQLEGYLGRFREASARDSDFGVPPDARVVSRAVVPQIPSFPKKLPIVALSTLAMLMLTVGAIVSRELLAPRPGEWRAADEGAPGAFADRSAPADFRFDLSHLGSGPILDARAERTTRPLGEADPAYDFGQLVERLSRSEMVGRGRRVLVCGIAGRDEAVRVARGLAITVAQRARTVLIDVDADEENPVDALLGFTDLVAGEASFSDVIGRDPESRVHQVGAGTLVNEALTGSPESIDLALEAFDATYEWVVCALLGDLEETLLPLLAPRVDAVVLASDLEPANPLLVRAYEAIRAAGGKDVVVAREQLAALDEAA